MKLEFRTSVLAGHALLALALWCRPAAAADASKAAAFHKEVQPLLEKLCYDCHADGMNKGNIAFDELKSDAAILENRDLWWKVLKNLQAGVMPPHKKTQPTDAERERIVQWIKSDAFSLDPAHPDPGRVTVRRLNRVEYRNTIRDLMGTDFDTGGEFPPDDTGHGFDNIADVLTISPMLLEKYMNAAKTIVSRTVPITPRVPAEKPSGGRILMETNGSFAGERRGYPVSLSYYEPAIASNVFRIEHAGRYQLILKFTAAEKYVDNQFDYNQCRFIFKVDGQEMLRKEYTRQENKPFQHEFEYDWQPGEHHLTLEVQPLTPDEPQVRSLALRVNSVTVRGPMDQQFWVRPPNYQRFFPKDVPAAEPARRDYARELLRNFARKAFRRPPDDRTVDRLASLAENVYRQPGKTFEAGIAHAMEAVLASPRFLFREEDIAPASSDRLHPLVDEYALASRLSYLFWSSMPDEELFRLAAEGKLRANLTAQVRRLLADSKSRAFVRNFTGQWLQARDVETVLIDARSIVAREDIELTKLTERRDQLRSKGRDRFTPEEREELEQIQRKFRAAPRADFPGELRNAMRQETERYFEHIVRENRPLVELIDSDYTFLNERLARHYKIEGVTGNDMRRVQLPPDSPRGGILGQGTVHAVTSNPTRTSPVKRGVFILDNILGMPPPPPPPNLPTLEDVARQFKDRQPTLRETLALHREQPLCSSCHNRMDPLGLAMDNFNPLGVWRDQERGQPIDAAGQLITGESFATIQELKRILATGHRRQFYRCLTEKLLTYALGRGVEYYDVATVDGIIARIEKEDGRFSALLMGVIESAPFQQRRNSVQQRAESKP